MPHKRAKRSVRVKLKSQQGEDMAPGKEQLSKEAIPKSFSRVIYASKIREEWRANKRKLEEAVPAPHAEKRRKLTASNEDKHTQNAEGKTKGKLIKSLLKIKPGESIQHFNRRVEDDMRPLVKTAMQSSNAVSRNTGKAEIHAKAKKRRQNNTTTKAPLDEDEKAKTKSTQKLIQPSPTHIVGQHSGPYKEFAEHLSSAPRRLNDIAQAPPEFKKLPRGATDPHGGIGSRKREGVLSMAQKSIMEQEREKAIARYRELKAQRKGTGGRDWDGVKEE